MRRTARILGVTVPALVFATQLSTYVVHELNATLRGPSAAEVVELARSLPDRVAVFDLTDADRRRKNPQDVKLALPARWLSGPPDRLRSPRRLLIFVDRRPTHHFASEPEDAPPTPYAYYRSRETGFVLLRCAAGDPCQEAILAHDDAAFDVALARMRLARHPRSAALMLAAIVLWIALAIVAGPPGLAVVLAAPVLLAAWIALDLQQSRWALPLLVLEALAVSAPLTLPIARTLGARMKEAWAAATSSRIDTSARLARVAAISGVAAVVAAPYIVTGRSWYPGNSDDSFFYLQGASRLLSSGSLIRGLSDLSGWVYSIYPVLLAAVARLADVHPMVAYRWLGYAGAALLPAALGLFTYAATGRLRAALLACWVGGLWGGLAGYLWLASDGLPAIARRQAPPVIWDDYYEGRFLGEYRGPHSEITAYVCRPPFYPREAGLVVFWPGLGLLYAGLLRPGLRRIVAFAVLATLSAAIYPYYGIAGLIVLVALAVPECRRLLAAGDRKRLGLLLAVFGVIALVLISIADFFVRRYKFPAGLLAYLLYLPIAPAGVHRSFTTLEFRAPRIVSGHFFMLAAMGLAFVSLRRQRSIGKSASSDWDRVRAWGGWPLFLTSLLISVGAGLAMRASGHVRLILYPYGWIVPWRALVEPVVVMGTALSLERMLERLSRRQRPLAAVLLLLPCFSALHWTVNADLFLRRAAAFSYGRGTYRSLYDDFARYGAQTLGHVTIREPLVAAPDVRWFMEAALGVRTVPATSGYAELLTAEERLKLLAIMAQGDIGDIATTRSHPALPAFLSSGAGTVVAAFGPYVIVRPQVTPGRSTAAPPAPAAAPSPGP